MSQQAQNFINLCKGNAPSTITMALKMLRPNVKNELMAHFKATSENELAIRIASNR